MGANTLCQQCLTEFDKNDCQCNWFILFKYARGNGGQGYSGTGTVDTESMRLRIRHIAL